MQSFVARRRIRSRRRTSGAWDMRMR